MNLTDTLKEGIRNGWIDLASIPLESLIERGFPKRVSAKWDKDGRPIEALLGDENILRCALRWGVSLSAIHAGGVPRAWLAKVREAVEAGGDPWERVVMDGWGRGLVDAWLKHGVNESIPLDDGRILRLEFVVESPRDSRLYGGKPYPAHVLQWLNTGRDGWPDFFELWNPPASWGLREAQVFNEAYLWFRDFLANPEAEIQSIERKARPLPNGFNVAGLFEAVADWFFSDARKGSPLDGARLSEGYPWLWTSGSDDVVDGDVEGGDDDKEKHKTLLQIEREAKTARILEYAKRGLPPRFIAKEMGMTKEAVKKQIQRHK
jgi:hypothetical protein